MWKVLFLDTHHLQEKWGTLLVETAKFEDILDDGTRIMFKIMFVST